MRLWNYVVTRQAHFALAASRGLGLSVEVSKPGYYSLKESRGTFGYAVGTNTDRPVPTKENPALFLLRRAGPPQSLVQFRRYLTPSKDGHVTTINVTTGDIVNSADSVSTLEIQTWVDDENKDPKRRFSWRLKLIVPHGGFRERTDEFEFEAPDDNYQSFVNIEMVPSRDANWSRQIKKEYFAKFSDRYGRIVIEYVAGGHNRLSLTAWYNPSGSRNLESGPEDKINVLNEP